MGTGAASFRRLVSAFHDFSKKLSPDEFRETNDYLKLLDLFLTLSTLFFALLFKKTLGFHHPVDNF
jgi:hypothetical protein